MRMRKKNWAEPFLQEHPEFVIVDPTKLRGQWKNHLNAEELHVEIGCGKGDYFIEMSNKSIDQAWIGIEKDRNVAAIAAKKGCDNPKSNRCMIAQDADSIEQWFSLNEIDVLHLNFSDPWPKTGYKKRRLSHKRFLDMYSRLLSKEGKVIMKTDNQGLFEFSVIEFTDNNWKIDEISVDFRRENHDEDTITEYESKFMSFGQPIYRAVFKLKK